MSAPFEDETASAVPPEEPTPGGDPPPGVGDEGGEPPDEARGGADEAGETAGASTPEEVSDPVAAVAAQRDEYLDALRRLQADFDNYRKRMVKQQADQSQRAAEDLVNKLLPVLDAIDLALVHAVGDSSSVADTGHRQGAAPTGEAPSASPGGEDVGQGAPVDQGDGGGTPGGGAEGGGPPGAAGRATEAETGALVQVSSALRDVLSKEGLERIDPQGQAFDPTEHDAVMHESDDGGGTAEVTEVLRAGYRWQGRVLRPAMVKVKS